MGCFCLSFQNCINQFTTLAQSGSCRFIGNVCLGMGGVTLAQLRPYYHAIVLVRMYACMRVHVVHPCVCVRVYIQVCQCHDITPLHTYPQAYGAEDDKVLGIPGEVCTYPNPSLLVSTPSFHCANVNVW